MGYVYKITNQVNGKMYVGMSERDDVNIRWQEHKKDYKYYATHSKRPLYKAMIKYGINNFSFDVLEETDKPQDREIYWINKLRTYIGFNDSNGYNATLGGDSRKTSFSDDEELTKLIDLYNKNYSINKISEILNHDARIISNKLKELNLPVKYLKNTKVVGIDVLTYQYDIYETIADAAKILDIKYNKICDAVNGRSHSAYGKFWIKYDDFKQKTFNDIVLYIQSLNIKPKNKNQYEKFIKQKRYHKIVNLNTKYVFSSVKDAASWCRLKSFKHINECCSNKRKHTGKNPYNGEALSWMYYEDYIEQFDENELIQFIND